VLLDGMPIDSCLFPVAAAAGREVETVESLWASEVGQRLQRSFVDGGGVQCGFCTPGFLITLTALLRDHPSPSEGEVREAVVGNICRCTGYSQIVDAAVAASRKGQG
jgi:carbon-monoxide dehydrogenase small subunit